MSERKVKKDWAYRSALKFWFADTKSGPWKEIDEPTQNTVQHIARLLRRAYKRGLVDGEARTQRKMSK